MKKYLPFLLSSSSFRYLRSSERCSTGIAHADVCNSELWFQQFSGMTDDPRSMEINDSGFVEFQGPTTITHTSFTGIK